MTDREAEIADALEEIVVGAVAITARAIAAVAADLTFLQWRVLVIVGASPGASVGDVAASIGAQASPASRLVSRLVRRGLVDASRDPRDRRLQRLTLSPAGEAVRKAVIRRRAEDLHTVAQHFLQGPDAMTTAGDGATAVDPAAAAALVRAVGASFTATL